VTQPNWQDMVAGESLLDWLNRTDTDRTWSRYLDTGAIYAKLGPNGTPEAAFTLHPAFTEDDWARARDRVLGVPTTPSTGAPVWPGLADVTLGISVALVDGLVVDGPMDGVLVAVTTAPTRTGHRVIGGKDLWYGMGEMTFGTDNGDLEPWVYMGFASAIFTPRAMNSAAHAYFRVLGGAGGTVTPWTKTVTGGP